MENVTILFSGDHSVKYPQSHNIRKLYLALLFLSYPIRTYAGTGGELSEWALKYISFVQVVLLLTIPLWIGVILGFSVLIAVVVKKVFSRNSEVEAQSFDTAKSAETKVSQ